MNFPDIGNSFKRGNKKKSNNYKNKSKINTIINILREEGQFDANQLQDETINFEQLILQEGFGAVNFDMWILLFKYEIPSIFISSKEIPETRFNKKEFVCYMDETHEDKFHFEDQSAVLKASSFIKKVLRIESV